MTKTTLLFFFACVSVAAHAQTNAADAATRLFENVPTRLSAADKTAVLQQTGFLLSADKKQFIADKDGADAPFDVQVFPTDLNHDGVEEIFMVYGNSYTSGATGTSVLLFIKNKTGAYKANLGFPGMAPDVLATSNQGYPDLLIGGPGFEFPVWRWNGQEYALYKNVKEVEYGKLKKTNLETRSKQYTATVPH